MEILTIDEKNIKRIEKYVKTSSMFMYGYEKDVELLKQNGQLTEKFAQEIFEDIIRKCKITRDIIEPSGELKEELSQVYDKFDEIPKPKEGYYYDGAYRDMDFADIYINMKTCFELLEVEERYDRINESRRIAENVITSIESIDKHAVQLDIRTREDLSKIKIGLEKTLQGEKTDVGFIQDSIDKYNEYALQVWNEYLTDVNDGKENDFRYLIHNCSKGEINEDFKTSVVSTSLITNKTMGVFHSNGGNEYGLILKPKHIISADYKDSYTYNYENGGRKIFNIKPPIRLPQEIEEICVNQTIEANGEMLNYDNDNIYSEIVVDDYEIAGIYYISNGERELSPNYEHAKRMADKRGIELKELDISRCRQDNGLELMTEKKQEEFCRTILYKYCCTDERLKEKFSRGSRTFCEVNYKNFYEKYKELRKNPQYTTEDILKCLKETAIDYDVRRWKNV